MIVSQNRVKTMEHVVIMSMTIDVTAWQVSMEPTVITVRI